MARAAGTEARPTAVLSGYILGSFVVAPHDGAGYDVSPVFLFSATENHDATSHGNKVGIYTVPDGSTAIALAMTIEQDQNIKLENGVYSKEKPAADADVSAYGQIWVTNNTPNTLYFTDDDGVDHPVSKGDIRFITVRLVPADTDVAVGAIGGDFVIQFTGTLLQDDNHKELLMAYNDTAGITGTMVVDVHKGGATIMTANKLDIETTEKNTTDAATQPDLTTTAVTKGDIFTFEVDSIHSGTAAKGLSVAFAIRMT